MPLPRKPTRSPARGLPTRIPGSVLTPQATSNQLPPSTRSAPRSPFTDLFPTFGIVTGHFTSIVLPETFVASATDTLAYCLRSYRAGRDVRDDFSVFSVDGTMLPADVAGEVPGGSPVAWGTGDTATARIARESGILIGINLGVEPNNWAVKNNLQLAGISGHTTNGTSLDRGGVPDLIHFEKFPIGTYTEPAIREKKFSRSFAPWVRRVPEGSSLDILFITRASAVANFGTYLNPVNINGYAMIQVGIGLTENEQRFTDT